MRKKNQTQMPLMPSNIEHARARELDRISQILEAIQNQSYFSQVQTDQERLLCQKTWP